MELLNRLVQMVKSLNHRPRGSTYLALALERGLLPLLLKMWQQYSSPDASGGYGHVELCRQDFIADVHVLFPDILLFSSYHRVYSAIAKSLSDADFQQAADMYARDKDCPCFAFFRSICG